MKKGLIFLPVLLLFLCLLVSCSCRHEWVEADCETPRTCTLCSGTEGEALGHSWQEASCTVPKTCTSCGETEGEPLGHSWTAATCDAPKSCSLCGETEGEILEHSWTAATCDAPKSCSLCGETEGEVLEHSWTAATCDTPKICTLCGKTEGDPRHTYDRWQIDNEANQMTGHCSVCHASETRGLDHQVIAETVLVGTWDTYMALYNDIAFPYTSICFTFYEDHTFKQWIDGSDGEYCGTWAYEIPETEETTDIDYFIRLDDGSASYPIFLTWREDHQRFELEEYFPDETNLYFVFFTKRLQPGE